MTSSSGTPKKEPAFSVKARYWNNRKDRRSNQPHWNVFTNFTPEEARKAAYWLMDMADDCELKGTTIRQYNSNGERLDDAIGFTMSHGFWMNKPKEGDELLPNGEPKFPTYYGKLSPLPPDLPLPEDQPETSGSHDDSMTDQTTGQECPIQAPPAQEQCPMPEAPAKQPAAATVSWS